MLAEGGSGPQPAQVKRQSRDGANSNPAQQRRCPRNGRMRTGLAAEELCGLLDRSPLFEHAVVMTSTQVRAFAATRRCDDGEIVVLQGFAAGGQVGAAGDPTPSSCSSAPGSTQAARATENAAAGYPRTGRHRQQHRGALTHAKLVIVASFHLTAGQLLLQRRVQLVSGGASGRSPEWARSRSISRARRLRWCCRGSCIGEGPGPGRSRSEG